jgi:hypothetical protein
MKKLSPLVLLLVVATLLLAPAASARPDTTRPGYIHQVRVVLKDKGLSLSQAHFLRGNEARFVIRNAGTRPSRFKAGFLSTKVLKRGEQAIMLIHLGLRGRFALEQWREGKQVAKVFIYVQ